MQRRKRPSHRKVHLLGPMNVPGNVYVMAHGAVRDRGTVNSSVSSRTSSPATFGVCMALARECKSSWVHVKYVGPQQQQQKQEESNGQ